MTIKFKKFYKGFVTRNYEETGNGFDIYNVDCVSEDLLNEIFTVKGERLMMPDYGTRIPLLVFELNDVYTHDIIREDLTTVFDHDPRVKTVNLTILPDYDRNVIAAIATINYLEFQVTQDLRIEVTSR